MATDERVKQTIGKVPMHLILWKPVRWFLRIRLYGLKKYKNSENYKEVEIINWWDACMRHMIKWFEGEKIDPESGLPHTAHALCNLMYLVEMTEDEPNFNIEEKTMGEVKTKISVIIPVYNQEKLVIDALDSIPVRDDIEIIVIDDYSTDDTGKNLYNYSVNHEDKHIRLFFNDINSGVGYTVNRGMLNATGEYIVLLGSDDYFLPEFNEFIDTQLDGTDLVYFNLRVNDGSIWRLREETKLGLCGSVKFMRREFIKDITVPFLRTGEDYDFYNKVLAKNPTEKFTDITVKHYNFPRAGSLTATGGINE